VSRDDYAPLLLTCDPDCDCECHTSFLGVPAAQRDAHAGRTCAGYAAWLDEDVYVRLSSLQNVSYYYDVSTRITRREWLDMHDDDVGEALIDAVTNHVEVTVLDDPRGDR
jgi:hypothetical protein